MQGFRQISGYSTDNDEYHDGRVPSRVRPQLACTDLCRQAPPLTRNSHTCATPPMSMAFGSNELSSG